MQFALKDVSRDAEALREFQSLGGRLPPLTVIDGALVTGFDLPRLETLLDRAEAMTDGNDYS